VIFRVNGVLDAGAGAFENPSLVPGNLQIVSAYRGNAGVTLNGDALSYLKLSAAGTDVALSGTLFGTALGGSLTFAAGTVFHVDVH